MDVSVCSCAFALLLPMFNTGAKFSSKNAGGLQSHLTNISLSVYKGPNSTSLLDCN